MERGAPGGGVGLQGDREGVQEESGVYEGLREGSAKAFGDQGVLGARMAQEEMGGFGGGSGTFNVAGGLRRS